MRGLLAFCGLWLAAAPAAATVSVVLSPPSATLGPSGAQQFTARVSGSQNTAVRWFVNGVPYGAPSIGLINADGYYVAPPDAPQTLSVVVEAVPAAAPAVTGRARVEVAAGPPPISTYYVAVNGSDGNPGTNAAPWRTIQHAASATPAGSQVLVKAGVYNELVTITRSGSAAAGFLTMAAAPGQAAVIDGTGLGIPGGQYGLVTLTNASWVRLKGFDIRNYVSNTAAVPIGVYVQGAGSHIEILDNHVHNIATTLANSNGDALGVAVYGSSAPASINWLTISGNELDHLTLGFSESLSLSGNVAWWEVDRNVIHDNNNIGINVEGYFGTAPLPGYDVARIGVVANNTVYNITSTKNPAYGDMPGADGIYVDGGAYVTVQNNLVYNSDIGVEMASETHGRATVGVSTHDNVVYHNFVTGISLGGADPNQNGGTRGCIVANNTLFENDTTQSGSGELQIYYNAVGNLIVDNIFYANSQGILINSVAPGAAPANLDHDLYYTAMGGGAPQWVWLGAFYGSFARFRTASGQEGHGVFANPQFVAAASADFKISRHLARGRPCRVSGAWRQRTFRFRRLAEGRGWRDRRRGLPALSRAEETFSPQRDASGIQGGPLRAHSSYLKLRHSLRPHY